MASLKLMQSYLCNRYQRTSVNASFSNGKETETGVPQRSIVGPMIFSILSIMVTFAIMLMIIRFILLEKNLNMVKENLKINFFIIQKWFYENHTVLNPEKCHYLVLEKRSNSDTINLNGTKLANSGYEKLLGILTDRDLSLASI